jgi:hypothetical protein
VSLRNQIDRYKPKSGIKVCELGSFSSSFPRRESLEVTKNEVVRRVAVSSIVWLDLIRVSKTIIVYFDPIAIWVLEVYLVNAVWAGRHRAFFFLCVEIVDMSLLKQFPVRFYRFYPQREVHIHVVLRVALRASDKVQLRMFAKTKKCMSAVFERIGNRLQSNVGTIKLCALLEISHMERNMIDLGELPRTRRLALG